MFSPGRAKGPTPGGLQRVDQDVTASDLDRSYVFLMPVRAGMSDPPSPRNAAHLVETMELVKRAWVAFGRCTAAEAPQIEHIEIIEGENVGIYDGTAQLSDGRLTIRLRDAEQKPFVVLHELAHFWVGWEPRALREGLSDLLAECAYRQIYGDPTFRYLHVDKLRSVPDLVAWEEDDELEPFEVMRHYAASYLLARQLQPMLAPEQLWDPKQTGSWAELWELVDGSPEIWRELARKLGSDDVDEDGLDWDAESRAFTDPFRWDTDGDGWWDGASPPEGAVALTAGPSCVGVLPEPREVSVRMGGPDVAAQQHSEAMPAGALVFDGGSERLRGWVQWDTGPLQPCGAGPQLGGAWPMSRVDPDGDGLVETEEIAHGTDLHAFDTDGDGWWDGAQPPSGAVRYAGPGWVCLGSAPRWVKPVKIGGPEPTGISGQLTADEGPGRRRVIGLQVQGPAEARAWLDVARPPGRCPQMQPLRPGTQCLGTPRKAQPIQLSVHGPFTGQLQIERRVDGLPRAEGEPVLPGERLEVVVQGLEGDSYGWITADVKLEPCPPRD
jgi:hypothetical protein